MKASMLVGLVTLAAGLAGASAPAQARNAVAGRWTGVLLRDGVQVPISVELAEGSGRLQVQDMSAPIEDIRVGIAGVHFTVPGEGIFDGTFAGGAMAGSVSGPAAGSFSLAREADAAHFDPIGTFGP
jgi:hypothetical protein